jgi:hypothetical protein
MYGLLRIKSFWKPVQESNDGCFIYCVKYQGCLHYIKSAPKGCSKSSGSLLGEARAYKQMPGAIKSVFVPVKGYYPGLPDGDYLVTLEPQVDGYCILPPSEFVQKYWDMDARVMYHALAMVLLKLFSNGMTHQDFHKGNFFFGYSIATRKVIVILLDPGCWEIRGVPSPYMDLCNNYLKKHHDRELTDFSEASIQTLERMLDAVTPIASVASLCSRRKGGDLKAFQESAINFIESSFGWKLDLNLKEWQKMWHNEIIRCVCTYLNALEPR